MIELLYRPREPIEKDINITAYEGWRGKKREKTKENAAKIANDLLSKSKYSKENIMRQLSTAIRRIDKHQAIARFVTIANYAIPALAGLIIRPPLHDLFQIVALAIAISPPSLLSGCYISESSRRRTLYYETKCNLEGRTVTQSIADAPTLDDIAEAL